MGRLTGGIAALLILFLVSPIQGEVELRDLGAAPEFTLVDQNGAAVSTADLAGRVWLADFIFTRCSQCAGVSSKLSDLAEILPEDVLFVSFSLDPSYDSGAVLAEYERAYNKTGRDWRFLTGGETEIHRLTREGFHLAVDRNDDAASEAEAIVHSLRLVLVDRNGRVRSYFDTEDPETLRTIRGAVSSLLHSPFILSLPSVNAALNLVCTVLLLNGFLLVKRGNVGAHKICMLAAFAVSAVFLVSYLYYHSHAGSVRFQSQGAIRSIYFAILISHTILAAVNVPLILVTMFFALTGRFERHRKFARVTFPSWLYVSVTGVVVYWLLYHVDVG